MANKRLCPRCGSAKIVDYDTTFECRNCNLEFKKDNLVNIEDEDLLSVQELKGILDGLIPKDEPNKLTELKDILDRDETLNYKK